MGSVAATNPEQELGFLAKLDAIDAVGLCPRDYRVMRYLFRHTTGRRPNICDHAQKAIAAKCKMSVSTVSKAVASLKQAGLIKTYTLHDHTGRINGQSYRLCWDRITDPQRLRLVTDPPLPLFDREEEPTRTSAVPGEDPSQNPKSKIQNPNTEGVGQDSADPGAEPRSVEGGEQPDAPRPDFGFLIHPPRMEGGDSRSFPRGAAPGPSGPEPTSAPPSAISPLVVRPDSPSTRLTTASAGNVVPPARDPIQNPKSKIQNGSPEALVRAFEIEHKGISLGPVSARDRQLADAILAEVGSLEEALALVPRVVRAVREKFGDCMRFGGAARYWDEAVARWKRQRQAPIVQRHPPPGPLPRPERDDTDWGALFRERLRAKAERRVDDPQMGKI